MREGERMDELFGQPAYEFDLNQENLHKGQQFWRVMDFPELSLAPTQHVTHQKTHTSSESENFQSKKRKSFSDHHHHPHPLFNSQETMIQTSVDLQLKDRLPMDWEQCLDLESGRMYYLNRKTLRKSWEWPKDEKLDLELNMSSYSSDPYSGGSKLKALEDSKKLHSSSSSSSSSNMVALPCLNCHLLIILSKSSPSCPNCKYVHSFPTQQIQPLKNQSINSLDTLSLLN